MKRMNVYAAMREGLLKEAISRKLLKRVSELEPAEIRRFVSNMAGQGRFAHLPNPTHRSAADTLEGLTQHPELLRHARKVENVPYLERGSQPWRQAMQDIKAGRMVTVESGGPMSGLMETVKSGPATYIESANAVNQAGQFAERGGNVRRGMYASPKGTVQTDMYATRYHKGKPLVEPAEETYLKGDVGGRLQAELPASLVQQGTGQEIRVPSAMWEQWARKPRVQAAQGAFPGRVTWARPERTGFGKLQRVEELEKRKNRVRDIDAKFWAKDDVPDDVMDRHLDRVQRIEKKLGM